MFSAAAAAKLPQSRPTLCDPIECSPLGSSVPGILQARILEWVAISFSNAWKWKVTVKSLSLAQVLATPWTGAYQAPPSMGFSRQEYWSGAFSRSCNSFVLSFFPLLWKFLTWIWSLPHVLCTVVSVFYLYWSSLWNSSVSYFILFCVLHLSNNALSYHQDLCGSGIELVLGVETQLPFRKFAV